MPQEDDPMPDAGIHDRPIPSATLLWDRQNCVPLDGCLSKDDLILLLTPVVEPPESQPNAASDPFEPLGQALSETYPLVRHVPYTKNGGVTGAHVAFIKKADVIIFIITGFPTGDEPSQPELGEAVREACGSRPLIVVFCCRIQGDMMQNYDFPTVIQTTGFSGSDLLTVSHLLLEGETTSSRSTTQSPQITPFTSTSWSIQPYDYERDLREVHLLWNENVPCQFRLDKTVLGSLLRRDGYAMHYVVRDPTSSGILGFCATFTTFADSKEEQLIGSIAALVVKDGFRRRGVGRALHDEALGRLGKIRGVYRAQLGTTFPRLLYGIPVDHPDTRWFQERGWSFDQSGPGTGRIMADWVLWFSDFRPLNLASAGLSFRSCEVSDSQRVLEVVGRESERKHGFGWYDQYARVIDSSFIGDVILGFEGSTMVAAAITYTPNDGNLTALDIPWVSSIGSDVGGVTCICIKDDDPEMVNRRDTVMVRLLYACCKALASRGMAGIFLDGLKANESGVETLGFRKWAQYREVWQHI